MNVSEACRELAAHGLVPWSSGNASFRAGDYMLIKASGVRCGKIIDVGAEKDHIASVRLSDGRHALAAKPSTDSEAHRFIYNHLPHINGIVHTHSTFCTTFACAHMPMPCVSTMQADIFGGEIPLSDWCTIGGEDIGKEVVRLYEQTNVPATLIRGHGIFCIADTLEHAVRNAILAEECAKVAWNIVRSSRIYTLPKEEIAANHKRYTTSYGQL